MAPCKCGCGQDAGVWPRTMDRTRRKGEPRAYAHDHYRPRAVVVAGKSAGNPGLAARLRQIREAGGWEALVAAVLGPRSTEG